MFSAVYATIVGTLPHPHISPFVMDRHIVLYLKGHEPEVEDVGSFMSTDHTGKGALTGIMQKV